MYKNLVTQTLFEKTVEVQIPPICITQAINKIIATAIHKITHTHLACICDQIF